MYSAELSKIVEAFQLENILPEISLEGRAVKKKEINRPALQLAGFYESFDNVNHSKDNTQNKYEY